MLKDSYPFLHFSTPEYDRPPFLVPPPDLKVPLSSTISPNANHELFRINPYHQVIPSDISFPNLSTLSTCAESKERKMETRLNRKPSNRNRNKRINEKDPYSKQLGPKAATKHRENEHKRRLEQKVAQNKVWDTTVTLVNQEGSVRKIHKDKYSLTQKLLYIDQILQLWKESIKRSPEKATEWQNILHTLPDI